MVLLSTNRAKKFDAQWLQSAATSAVLLLATGAAAGLVVTGLLPEASSPALLRQTVLAPNLAVVCLRDGCGCDKRPLSWVQEATKQGNSVLVVVDGERVTNKEVHDFRKVLPDGNITFHYTRSSPLLKRHAPSGESTLTLTRFGTILFQSPDVGTSANFSHMKGLSR